MRPSAGIGVVEVQKLELFCVFVGRDPLRGSAWLRCKTQGFLRFYGARMNPLRGSAWSRCKNSVFLFFAVPARPSAGIGVVEVQKLEVFCVDLLANWSLAIVSFTFVCLCPVCLFFSSCCFVSSLFCQLCSAPGTGPVWLCGLPRLCLRSGTAALRSLFGPCAAFPAPAWPSTLSCPRSAPARPYGSVRPCALSSLHGPSPRPWRCGFV